jgi:hypothetical protein
MVKIFFEKESSLQALNLCFIDYILTSQHLFHKKYFLLKWMIQKTGIIVFIIKIANKHVRKNIFPLSSLLRIPSLRWVRCYIIWLSWHWRLKCWMENLPWLSNLSKGKKKRKHLVFKTSRMPYCKVKELDEYTPNEFPSR